MQRMRFVVSHTEGEPTRVVIAGDFALGQGPVAELRERLRCEHDWLRRAVVNEPRGSDVLVGALLCKPADPTCVAGVIFFNNVGYLGMCGHGTIGVMTTLRHLGWIGAGVHRLETPVGVVTATLQESGFVTVENVASYRYSSGVIVEIPGYGRVTGDVAWGGNWFFLAEDPGLGIRLENVDRLTVFTRKLRTILEAQGVTGEDGIIDHIELFGPSLRSDADSKNFVLCPGGVYDRSPCGTGTSAKVACLAADGKLKEGEIWRQEGIAGGLFEASYRRVGDRIIPSVTGRAYLTAEGELLLDPSDPFRTGIGS